MKTDYARKTEHQLILQLLKTNSDQTNLTELVKQPIDWKYLLESANEHCIIPLIYKELERNLKDKIPSDVLSKLKLRYLKISKRNFFLSTQVIKIMLELQRHDLDFLSYKGMTLAQIAYGDISLRQFGDIDVLIQKEDFPQIKEILLNLGCRPFWKLTPKQERAVLKNYYEYPFIYSQSKTLIEVHWAFVEPFFSFDYDVKKIWKRTRQINICGKDVPTLPPEDYLIVLCSHGSKHFWKRLSWICDVGKLVENTEIDWDTVIKRATKLESLRMVWLGLYLAKEITNIELPDDITNQINADEYAVLLGEDFKKSVFAEEKEPEEWTEMAKIHLLMREKLRTKLKYTYRLFKTKLTDKLFMPMGRPQ
jgi:hypothetical protein